MTIRSTLSFVATLLAVAPIHAQSVGRANPQPRFGIIGGVNVTSVTDTDETRQLTGPYIGAQLVLPRNDYFSIQLELAWSQKGVRAAGRDLTTGEALDVTLRNAYVELPILMRLDSPLAIGVEPYGAIPFFVLGPALGISAKCEIAGESATGTVSYDCDDDFGVKTFDFSAMGGLGLDAMIGTRTVSLAARYTVGLQDMFEGNSGRNRAVGVVAGVTF